MSWDGFRYDRSDEDGHPITTIRIGPAGQRMLRAMRAATAMLTRHGVDVIVDEMLLAPDLLASWTEALAGVDVLFVGVHCPLAVLEQRERDRRQPTGLARGYLRTVHSHGRRNDLQVDTATAAPDDLARHILAHQR